MRSLLLLLLATLLAGCTMPRIIILNDPLDAREHNDLGVAYEHRGELDLAAREYGRAADLDRQWALPLINRGNVFAAGEDWRQAAKEYRRALQREPGNAGAANNLAWVLLQDRRPAKALPWAKQAVAAAPLEPAYLDTLSEVQLALGETDVARRLIEQALSLSPPPPLRELLEARKARLDSTP